MDKPTPQIPLIEGQVSVVPEVPADPITVYLVAAFLPGWGWRICRDTYFEQYATRELANKATMELPAIWRNIRVIEVILK